VLKAEGNNAADVRFSVTWQTIYSSMVGSVTVISFFIPPRRTVNVMSFAQPF
jgi:hypothetical protein